LIGRHEDLRPGKSSVGPGIALLFRSALNEDRIVLGAFDRRREHSSAGSSGVFNFDGPDVERDESLVESTASVDACSQEAPSTGGPGRGRPATLSGPAAAVGARRPWM